MEGVVPVKEWATMCDGDRDRVAVCLELNIAAVVFKDGVEFWSVPRSLSDTFQCIGTLFLGMYSIYPREVFACTDPSELIVAHRRKMLAVCPVSMKQIGEFDVGYADSGTDDLHHGSMCTGMVGGCALLGVCVHTNNEALGVKLFEHCGPGAWTCAGVELAPRIFRVGACHAEFRLGVHRIHLDDSREHVSWRQLPVEFVQVLLVRRGFVYCCS
jgi:hypothetical protein